MMSVSDSWCSGWRLLAPAISQCGGGFCFRGLLNVARPFVVVVACDAIGTFRDTPYLPLSSSFQHVGPLRKAGSQIRLFHSYSIPFRPLLFAPLRPSWR